MAKLGRGQSSSCAHPVLDLYTSVDGRLVDVASLQFEVLDLSSGAPGTAPRLVSARRALDPTQSCPDGARLARGHYAASWTAPGDEPLGTHEIRWHFRVAPGAPEYTFVEEFELVPVVPELPGAGYCTVADLRAEGVTEHQASDDRLRALIEEASQTIDRLTGWWFEPRWRRLRVDGRGTPSIEPPAPPIRLDRILIYGTELSRREEAISVRGAPVGPGFDAPLIRRTRGHFPREPGSVELEGVFGYTEEDGTELGRTPLEIRRACILLVIRLLPRLGDIDAVDDARNRWRVVEERTRDQAIKFAPLARPGQLTGDTAIDDLLAGYMRPAGLGAA